MKKRVLYWGLIVSITSYAPSAQTQRSTQSDALAQKSNEAHVQARVKWEHEVHPQHEPPDVY
ncbi:hypothetical protein DTO96_101196 [Ephemeroptericola cinctiostellae]|uniref:Uncharacterized protein n=1 Tax=Ephemeroptericola cinctiostellae TaxID=2268024 RepID=A0A345DAS7_9BURK|nr:hypothetical protein DTO96_101196 [Ephemeroptericola cinctiostellae]